mgnify:CR=1 FL=1
MEQLNKVELTGSVGSVRVQNIGDKVSVHFSLVTNVIYRNPEGEAVCETTWHNVRKLTEKDDPLILKLSKGANAHVLGRLKNYRYTGIDGSDRTGTEVVASSVRVIEDADAKPQDLNSQ